MPDPKPKKADLFSVAKAAKVSPSTVSRFFNHPELLKHATRKRIDAAVRRQGYIRNRAAQTIHGIRSGTIGVLVPTLDHTIFAEAVQAFSDAVAPQGFTILLASHGYDLQREYEILRKFLEHRVDGVVLTGLDHDDAVFQLIDSQDIPAVLMWNYAAGSKYPSVGADNEMAGRLIAQHVLDLGHRDIACMFPPTTGNDRALARLAAVQSTLKAAGVTVRAEWNLTTVYSISASKRDTQALLQNHAPTALICGNDILATGALYGAVASGLSVPSDISVLGIGDFKGAAEIEPALTTVRLPARQIGQEAGRILVGAITDKTGGDGGDGGGGGGASGTHCAPELIVRTSSGAPPKPGSA